MEEVREEGQTDHGHWASVTCPSHWSPNLPLVALLTSRMIPSQLSNGTYLILRESQRHQKAQNTRLLTSLLPSPLAHLLQLPHRGPAYSWQRARHTPASGPLYFLCVCQQALPLDIFPAHSSGLNSKVTFPMGLSWRP